MAHFIVTREVCYVADDGTMIRDYNIGADKRTSGIAVVNIDDIDEVIGNVLKISCDSMAKTGFATIYQTLTEYMGDSDFIFEFTCDKIVIRMKDVGTTTIMWTKLDKQVRVSKIDDSKGIIETRVEDLYFI